MAQVEHTGRFQSVWMNGCIADIHELPAGVNIGADSGTCAGDLGGNIIGMDGFGSDVEQVSILMGHGNVPDIIGQCSVIQFGLNVNDAVYVGVNFVFELLCSSCFSGP